MLEYLKKVIFLDVLFDVNVIFNKNGDVDGKYDLLNFKLVNGIY